jgi:hypothetical protein
MNTKSLNNSLSHPKYIEECEMSLTQQDFDLLVSYWKFTTYCYTKKEKTEHSTYNTIVMYDKEALPFIFNEMKMRPDWWFDALERITGENPVKEENKGDLRKMTIDWLKWAKENNYFGLESKTT